MLRRVLLRAGGTTRPERRMRSGSGSLITTRSKRGLSWWRATAYDPGRSGIWIRAIALIMKKKRAEAHQQQDRPDRLEQREALGAHEPRRGAQQQDQEHLESPAPPVARPPHPGHHQSTTEKAARAQRLGLRPRISTPPIAATTADAVKIRAITAEIAAPTTTTRGRSPSASGLSSARAAAPAPQRGGPSAPGLSSGSPAAAPFLARRPPRRCAWSSPRLRSRFAIRRRRP